MAKVDFRTLPTGKIDGSIDNKKNLIVERGNSEGTIAIVWDRVKLIKQEFKVSKDSSWNSFITFDNGKNQWL